MRIRALRSLARSPRVQLLRTNKPVMERCVDLLVSARTIEQRRAARECLLAVRSPHAVPPLLRALEAKHFSRRIAAFHVLRDYSGGRGPGPLAGVRVIESSLLGPAAITTHLADLGAEVIKVEAPSPRRPFQIGRSHRKAGRRRSR